MTSNIEEWPDIPFDDWRETASALHLYSQIVGKYRLARSPWVNHSWHATLYTTTRGLTTGVIPDGDGIEIVFDFPDGVVRGHCGHSLVREFELKAMSVARFHAQFKTLVSELGGNPDFHGRPNELPDPVRFEDDREDRPWDAEAVARFHRALVSVAHTFELFRTGFRGKVSPVHLFWGSFDLAVTRFSGRRAPLHPGGIPALPDDVTQEAYSHEVSSAGFWPGGGPVDEAAFYSYAYPAPDGFPDATVAPEAAYFDKKFGEFILTYEAVRNSDDPEATLLEFLETSYETAARLGDWDRSLECERGVYGRPPRID